MMAMGKNQPQKEETPAAGGAEALKEMLMAELEQNRSEVREIDMMLEQSQSEVNKLTQRNASVTIHLQQIQAQFDNTPRSDIRTAYDTALDAQQRLFVMRGQLDKLQSDRNRIAHYQSLLEQAASVLDSVPSQATQSKNLSSSTIETLGMVLRAQEAERQTLARGMHDGPAQALSNFILLTDIAMRWLDKDQSKAKEELQSLKVAASTTFQKVRDFIFDLRPMMLDDLGLSPTITRYIEAFKEQSGMDIRLTITGLEHRLESYLEVLIFRAVQELLKNAARFSQASQIKVQIDANDAVVKVSVEDNGRGFDVEATVEQGGMGLKVIRERVDMLGGSIDITSSQGQGTRVAFQVPAAKTKVFA